MVFYFKNFTFCLLIFCQFWFWCLRISRIMWPVFSPLNEMESMVNWNTTIPLTVGVTLTEKCLKTGNKWTLKYVNGNLTDRKIISSVLVFCACANFCDLLKLFFLYLTGKPRALHAHRQPTKCTVTIDTDC